jgi:hypothetical protein
MLWRLEQGYYRDGGWAPVKIDIITNGLMRTSITETTDLENAGH